MFRTDSQGIENKDGLYRAAVSMTLLAGVFLVLFVAFMGLRYVRFRHVLPQQEDHLAAIKTRLAVEPENEGLVEQFRELDLAARRVRFQWYDMGSWAGWVVLFNSVVLIGGVKLVGQIKSGVWVPGESVKYEQSYIRNSRYARLAVGAGYGVLGLTAVFVGVFGRGVDFYIADEQLVEAERPLAAASFADAEQMAANWPRFRGYDGSGVSRYTDIPDSWDIETGENILWQSEIPLDGRNSPIVWEDRVFLTGADENRKEVYCYDADSGELLWVGVVDDIGVGTEQLDIYPDTGYAASTAYTDGRHVYAFFPNGDVAAFDFEGDKVWAVNIGRPDNIYGHAVSLVGYEDKVIIQYDNGLDDDDLSWLIALDGASGETLWRTPRPVMNSWTTPVIVQTEAGPELITVSEPYVIAYDPRDGLERWRSDCVSGEIAPSTIYAGGAVYAMSPYVRMAAIEPGREGTVEESEFRWTITRGIPDISSPVSDGRRIYLLGTYGGALAVHDVQSGELIWQERLGGEFNASGSVVGQKVYFFSVDGVGYVLEAGDEFVELGRYELGQEVHASPAFGPGRMYVRGDSHLFCIGFDE